MMATRGTWGGWVVGAVVVTLSWGEAVLHMSPHEDYDVDLRQDSVLGTPFTACASSQKYTVTIEGTTDPVVVSGLEKNSPTNMTLRCNTATTIRMTLVCVSHSEQLLGTAVINITVNEETVPAQNSTTAGISNGSTTTQYEGSSDAPTNVSTTTISEGSSKAPTNVSTTQSSTDNPTTSQSIETGTTGVSINPAATTTVQASEQITTTKTDETTTVTKEVLETTTATTESMTTSSTTASNSAFREDKKTTQPAFRPRHEGEGVIVGVILISSFVLLCYLLRDKLRNCLRSRQGQPYDAVASTEMTPLSESDVQSRTNAVPPPKTSPQLNEWDVSEDKWQ